MTGVERYLWDLRGYLVVRGALSPERLAALRDAVEGCPAHAGSPGGLLSLPKPHSTPFRELLADPAVVGRLNAVCGKGFRLDAGPTLVSAPEREPATVRRTAITPGSAYHYQNGRSVAERVTVLWTLRDVDGELALVPGSHKANVQRSEALGAGDLDDPVVRPSLHAGDALMVAEGVETRGRRHESPWAVSLAYCPRILMVDVPDQCLVRPEIWWDDPRLNDLLTAEQRAVMVGPGSSTDGEVTVMTVTDAGVVELVSDQDERE